SNQLRTRKPQAQHRSAARVCGNVPRLRPSAPGLRVGSPTVRRPSVQLAAQETPRKEAEMHALVVRVTIHNADRTRDVLNSQVVPQVSGAPGFKTGYWTWATGGGEANGRAVI